jgi:hypothetical protein
MDHHVRRAITAGLRLRGVDVLTAYEDGSDRLPDPLLLDRATTLGRVLFSQDRDLLREAARRQASGERFVGVIFGEQLAMTIGRCIDERELVAKAYEPDDISNRVEYLPL